MIDSKTAGDIVYTVVYGLSVFNNVLFILYLIIQRLKTSVDRLIFSLSVVQLLLVIFGIPFLYDVWVGEPYKYGSFGCRALVPIHSILDFSEAFLFSMMAVFIAEKLRGDQDVKWRVLAFLLCIYISSVVMVLPYFGVVMLGTKSGSSETFCIEDWNANAEKIHRVSKVLLQYFIPLGIIIYHHRKGVRIVRYIMHYLDTGRSSARYQSFAKAIAESPDYQSSSSHLRFTESEEMNLEMNHLYQKHNSISTIRKDSGTSRISVQIYTNEVEIEKIDSQSPLWRGRPKVGEFQKMVVSIKWFRYTRNIFQTFLISAIVYLIVVTPFQFFLLYTVGRSPYDFTENEKLVGKVIFCLRFLTCMVNPWLFMVGVFKYRKSLFGRCYPHPRDFMFLPGSIDNTNDTNGS